MIARARPIVRRIACHPVKRPSCRAGEDAYSHQPHPGRLTGGVPEDDEIADRDRHRRQRKERLSEPLGPHAADHRRDEAGGAAHDRSTGDYRERIDDQCDAAARHARERRGRRSARAQREPRVETGRGRTRADHDLFGKSRGLRRQRGTDLRTREYALERLLRRVACEHAVDHFAGLEGLPAPSRADAPAPQRPRAPGRSAPRPDAGPTIAPAPPAAGPRVSDRPPA